MVTWLARPHRFTLLVIGAALLFSTAPVSAQTALRWKFQTGQVLEQTITQDTKYSVTLGTQNIDNTANQIIDAVWVVGDVDSQGVADVTQQIKRIRMRIGGMLNIDIDSASNQELVGQAAALAPAVKAMAKAKFEMKMSPFGEILAVELSQETLDGLKALPNAGQVSGVFTKDSLVNMIKQGAPAMPKEAVRQGSTWSSDMEIAMAQLGKMASHTTLTYVGPELVAGKPLERINMVVATKLEPGAGGAAAITIKDQKAQGALYFDNVAGRIDHSSLTQEMTMQVATATSKIDQKVQTVIQVVLKPAASAAP